MKTLTLSLSDTLYDELQSMCESDQDTPERIAAGIIFDALYGEDIEELWNAYGKLAVAFETDEELDAAMRNFSDILVICEDTSALSKEDAHHYLEDAVEYLETYEETNYDGSRRLALSFLQQTYNRYKDDMMAEAKRLQSLNVADFEEDEHFHGNEHPHVHD